MKYLFLIMLISLCACRSNDNNPQPSGEIPVSTLKEARIDENKIATLQKEISSGKYNIHSILLLRHNKLAYEHYFPGEDAVFPLLPVGRVEHAHDSLHDCMSVTKSVVSACIGMAIAEGKIKSINDNIFNYLTGYEKYQTGTKKDLTIRHLLMMSSGLEWHEDVDYRDPGNSERQMSERSDVVDFVLSYNQVAAPGSTWSYSGGCTMLLSKILQRATGERIDSFARRRIFEPLGISKFNWAVREDGTVWATSGLRLRSIDMAKFGMLYMNKGRWNNQQLIPVSWVLESTKWQINTDDPIAQGYGYQFWCARPTIGQPVDVVMAVGFGGQRICLIPSLDVEIVMTAGNYNELSDTSDKLLEQYIFPAIQP
ncbi:MAG TPA: serine hydrolase [Chitinophaga sp.]|uniref:serine hydrolase domain-containing protein n=1 Tax=Chitinophaga sp. TaxID=1869181 RepID=UPI002C533B90|nr:serine hydrolase [Chitinophaga sp.]HVI48931.1 serine hydrolase [Chitinophaga sp.]